MTSTSLRHATLAVVDSLMLVAFIALMDPNGVSGFVWHEWIGLAFIPLFVIHIVLAWGWITGTWARLRGDSGGKARINFLLNTSLFVMMCVLLVSGVIISDYAMPVMGIHINGLPQWQQLHNLTSSLTVAIVGLHVAVNWSWIKGAWRRYVR